MRATIRAGNLDVESDASTGRGKPMRVSAPASRIVVDIDRGAHPPCLTIRTFDVDKERGVRSRISSRRLTVMRRDFELQLTEEDIKVVLQRAAELGMLPIPGMADLLNAHGALSACVRKLTPAGAHTER
jgi:hypothetical protein